MTEFYNTINGGFLIVGYLLLLFLIRRGVTTLEVAMLIAAAILILTLSPLLGAYFVGNVCLIFLCSYFSLGRDTALDAYQRQREINYAPHCLVIVLALIAFSLRGQVGWQSVASSSIVYWALFIFAYIYTLSASVAGKSFTVFGLIAFGLVVTSKVAILSGLLILIHQVLFYRTFHSIFRYSILGSVFVALALMFYSEPIFIFLEDSVFRRGYFGDTKILGFSDGARLEIWGYYIEGAKLFGKGDFFYSFEVPTHNFFVYIANEAGLIPAGICLLLFVPLAFEINKHSGFSVLVVLLVGMNLSSFLEYTSAWIPALLMIPIAMKSTLTEFRFGIRRYAV